MEVVKRKQSKKEGIRAEKRERERERHMDRKTSIVCSIKDIKGITLSFDIFTQNSSHSFILFYYLNVVWCASGFREREVRSHSAVPAELLAAWAVSKAAFLLLPTTALPGTTPSSASSPAPSPALFFLGVSSSAFS